MTLKLRAPLGPKGQVVIPKPLREALDLRPGDEVLLSLAEGRAWIEKKGGEELLEEMLSAFPKRKPPRRIDWDRLYYGQLKR